MTSDSGYSVNEILRRSTALAQDDIEEALALVETALDSARRMLDTLGVVTLARHAGVLWSKQGNLVRAQQCYAEALKHDPTSVYLHLANADVLERLEQLESAEESLVLAEKLAGDTGDAELVSAAGKALSRIRARLSIRNTPD